MLSPLNTQTFSSAGVVPHESATNPGLSPEARLLALVIHSQVSQMHSAETSINLSYEDLAKLRQEAIDAIHRAREAEADSGFWGALSDFFGGEVGAIAAAVAALAAVVATGGAAAAVLAAVAAAASIAAQHAEELGIPPEVAIGIAIVATAASLCCGNAGALFKVSDVVKAVACQVRVAATATGGVAAAASGGTGIAAASYARDAQDARADARWANGGEDLANADIDEAIRLFSRVMDQKLFATDQVTQMQQNEQKSRTAMMFNLAGAA